MPDERIVPNPAEEAYWAGLRHALMLDPTVTYLNNGSFGPCPKIVFDVVVESMRRLQSQPFQQFLREIPQAVRASKEKLGAYVGANPDDFAFVMNLTIGMNMVAGGLDFERGDEILTTDQEYGAVNNCWNYLAERQGLTIARVAIPSPPESEDQIVDIVASGITPRTKALLVSHITTTTGLIMPVKRLAQAARERGVLSVIDGAHAPGMIPLNVEDSGADFYIGNCHKWLMAPIGTAFLHARPESQKLLHPTIVGWGLTWDALRRVIAADQSDMYRLFEFLGSRDLSPFAGVGAAVDFQRGIGIDRIAGRGRRLARYARTRLLDAIPGVTLLTPWDERLSGSLTAFTMPTLTERDLMAEVWDRFRMQILGRVTENPEVTRCRLSTHYYNTYEDIDRFIEILHELGAGR
ncbi:MAG: aminotransferase class V-fold PLP-dependent enzyme [Candidatus Latescibacteria bacterium]|nr:aminotransferase class V-fold PLP-dependent enzyme [Candidatus Latescibacterota bacterium]